MDVLAAMIFGIIIVKSVMDKGYTATHVKYKVVRNASLVAAIALLVIYFGPTYLGATVSGTYNLRINRSELLVNITSGLLGHAGVIILGMARTGLPDNSCCTGQCQCRLFQHTVKRPAVL